MWPVFVHLSVWKAVDISSGHHLTAHERDLANWRVFQVSHAHWGWLAGEGAHAASAKRVMRKPVDGARLDKLDLFKLGYKKGNPKECY